MSRSTTPVVFLIASLLVPCGDAFARNERRPPPPVLVSGGGLPGGDLPWLPDDPDGGGGGGTGGGGGGNPWNHNYGFPSEGPPLGGVDTRGDGGWDWWNDKDFWGWGSGWWRYPVPIPPGGGGGGAEGGGGDGCGQLPADRVENGGCRIATPGPNDNACNCYLKATVNGNGEVTWVDECAYCMLQPSSPSPNCEGKRQADPCGSL